jgi:cytochrome c oxidase assembly protein subunit 15
MAFFQLGLRRAAAHLSRVPVVCAPCLRQQQVSATAAAASVSRALRLVKPAVRRHISTVTAEPKTPLGTLGSSIIQASRPAAQSSGKSSSWPGINAKVVGYWLVGSAVSVFGIVVWGGLTRLTESG